MQYEIRTATAPPSTPYDVLQEAVEAAREYSACWERRRKFRVHELPSGRLVATVFRGVVNHALHHPGV
jgi:hypothetical protein